MRAVVRFVGIALGIVCLAAGPVTSAVAEDGAAARSEDSASDRETAPPSKPPPRKVKPLTIYVPPNPGAPKTRIAGTTRSGSDLPEIQVLAPDHTGHTTREQPTLWWWLSAATNERVDLTVNDPDVAEPLLEVTLPGPFAAGDHAVALADHGVRLAEGKDYEFFVAIVPDARRRSSDVVAGGAIRRVAGSGSTPASGLAQARAWAGQGVWFDAIDALSTAKDAEARTLRRDMLAAEGLVLDAR